MALMKFFFLEFKYGSNVPFWTSRKKQQIGGLHKFYVTTQKFFIKYQMFKYSRETFAMIWKCQKFFSVFEIFEVAFRERNHLGIRNVTFRLFVNNYHLYFFCQIITYGHHLSKNIIASQFSQFSFLAVFWRIGPYLSPITQYKKVIITKSSYIDLV